MNKTIIRKANPYDYIKGNLIKKSFLFYWFTLPIFKLEGKINKFLFSIIIIIIYLSLFLTYYYVTSTLFYSLEFLRSYVNLIIGFIFVFLFWKTNHSYQKMTIMINDFIELINYKFEIEFNLYIFILEDALISLHKGFGSITSKELFLKKENLRHKDFTNYFKYLEDQYDMKISKTILKSLIMIHFNTDYEKNYKDSNYGTKILHPLFLELKKRNKISNF